MCLDGDSNSIAPFWGKFGRMTVIVTEQEANQSTGGVKMIIQCRTLLQDVDFGVIPVPILGDAALWLITAGHWLVPPF